MAQQRAYPQEVTVGFMLSLHRNALSKLRHECLSVRSLVSLNRCKYRVHILHIALDGFHLLLAQVCSQVWCRVYIILRSGLLLL